MTVKIAMLEMTHGHTRKYYQVLRENPLLDWVGATASDPVAKARFFENVQGIPCYDTPEALFDAHPELQAVVIASENDKHFTLFEQCARRGLDVLMMKIPTFDMKEYDEMIALAKRHGIVCQVELELHYNPTVNRLKSLVASGELGRLQAIQATNVTLCSAFAFPWQGTP